MSSPRIAPLQPPPSTNRSKHRSSTSGTSSPLSASPRIIATTAHSRSSSTNAAAAAGPEPSFPSLAPNAEPDFLSGSTNAHTHAQSVAHPSEGAAPVKEQGSKPTSSGDLLDFLSLNVASAPAAPAQPRPASPVEIQGLEPVVRRKLNISVATAGPSEEIDVEDDMSATPAPSTPVGTVSLRSKAKISAGRTRVDSPGAPGRKSMTYKPLTITVAPAAAGSASPPIADSTAPQVPPSPKSPKNNPNPNVERIRRTSTTFRDKVLTNALPMLLEGRAFAIHRNKILGQQEISGPVISQETTRAFIPIRVSEDLMHLVWREDDVDPMHSKISLLDVDQVTRWLSAEEKSSLGNATKAAFSVIFGAGSAQGERRVTFLAPDEETLNTWTTGLTELVSKLDTAKKAQKLQTVTKDIPDLYVEVWLGEGSADFRPLIEAEVFNRPLTPAARPPQRASVSGPAVPLQNELAGSPVGGRRKFSVTGGTEVRTSEYGQRFSVSNNSNERKGVLKRINVFPFLRRGMDFLKFGRRGTPHFRKFKLAKDNRTLIWTSKFKSADESSVPLDSVDELRLGQATYVFERNNARPELEGASFSLVYEKRQKTLDLIAITSNAYNLWTAGIQKLIEFIQVSTPEDIGTMTELYAEVLISDSPTNYMPMIDRFY